MEKEKLINYQIEKPDEIMFNSALGEGESDSIVLNKLRQAQRKKEAVLGYCSKCLKDGTLLIDFSDKVKGYIPREEVSYKVEKDGRVHIDKARGRVGLTIKCAVKEIKEENGEFRVMLSRKDVVEKVKDKYIKELKEGMIVTGVVVNLNDNGAMIDIGGDVVGLLGVGRISRIFIDKPSDVLSVGQIVNVVITKWHVNDDKGFQIEFDREILLPTFDDIDKYYKEGETVMGKVKNKMNTGHFIQLDENFEGLVDFMPNVKLTKGETVRVRITRIDKKNERIKLELKL